jgi:hypothetical protein
MDAFCISKNGIQELAAELTPLAGVGFNLNWYGNPNQGIAIYVTRTNQLARQERWKDLQVLVGDRVAFVTREVSTVDKPIERFTDEELVNLARAKSKMKPGKAMRTPVREVGFLDCDINNKPLFSCRLTTDNMLSVGVVWLGDKTGMAVMHMGSEVSSKPQIPEIVFGDEVTFRTIHRR